MDLNDELDGLNRWQSAVFAASCVEVLFSSYSRFVEIEQVGDSEFVRSTLDAVWERLELGDADAGAGGALPSSDEVLRLLPAADDWNDWAAQAENAIGALGIVLGIMHGHGAASAAADAAYQAYEAADELDNRWEFDENSSGDEDDGDVLGSSAVDDETERQEDAVRELLEGRSGDGALARTLRDKARERPWGGTEAST